MKVVLLQDVKSQGKKGDLIDVSEGYARNFLFPKKLAVAAGSQVLTEIKSKEEAKEYHTANEIAKAKEIKAQLESKTLSLKKQGGEGDRLYGSVTNKEIQEAIKTNYGIDLDKRKIVLPKAIKDFGEFDVIVKLYTDIQAEIKLVITKD